MTKNNTFKSAIDMSKTIFVVLLLLSTCFPLAAFAQKQDCNEARLRDLQIAIVNCTGENDCTLPTATPGFGSMKSGDSIYILGDSITVEATPLYGAKFSEKGISTQINAFLGRSWTSGGGFFGGTPARDAVQTDAAKIQSSKGIVIALGSNNGIAGNPIDQVINGIREKNPNAPIWWVNTASTRADLGNLGEFNAALESEAGNRNFRIIDWFKTIDPSGNPKSPPVKDTIGLLGDGLHPNPEGQKRLVDLVVSSVTSESPSGTPTGGCECSVGSNGPISMTASNNIPEPHKAVFERAASKFAVNPNLIAALFLSEQGNVWKPFDSPWASSPAGASGPFQFMPGTWGAYKEDGNGDGVTDIMNFEDAAYAAAKLAATGTNQSTPLGDLNKPFAPNTMIFFSATYNWGGGNVQNKTNPDSPITAAPKETQNYMNNIHMVISSDFTKSGHSAYGPPRMPGQTVNQTPADGTNTSSGNCVSSGGDTGLATSNPTEARQKILSSSNVMWGNYGSATSQKSDIEGCMTDTALISIATIIQNSGVQIPVNALATDHGGCSASGGSLHNHGRAIDIGYYGNASAGADRHKPEGDTLYKFLFDNRNVLKIDELIWQYPPSGYKCIDGGNVGECDTIYNAATMNQHYHHIHVGFLN